MRKILLLFCFSLLSVAGYAPNIKSMPIAKGKPVNPYLKIAIAISQVESGSQDTAVNRLEGATGRYQIRQIMLDQYNFETGESLCLEMMKDSATATKVFLHHANKYHYTDIESISRTWNGGMTGMAKTSTLPYFLKVSEQINKYRILFGS